MDEKYLYIFIRQDLPIEHQLVQASHAIYSLATLTQFEFTVPNIIAIGVPDLNALNKVLKKLEANQIIHYCWHEPDYDFGFTAIATEPISSEKREVLSNYRLLKHNEAGSVKADCSIKADCLPNSGVAQLQSTGL